MDIAVAPGVDRIDAGPVARVRPPRRVPTGFQATWARADRMRA